MNRRLLPHILAGVSFTMTLAGCDPCENRVLQEFLDPTATTKAVIFQRSCGTLGGTSTQVSLLPASTSHLIAGGNVFSADTNDGAAPALPSGGPPVVVTWANPQALYVTYDSRVRVFQAATLVRGVSVSYEARSATSKLSSNTSPAPLKTRKTGNTNSQ